MGVSPRRLSGWEPRVVTDHQYDQGGRIVQSTITTEPEWDEEQVALLIASERLQADLGSHGHPMAEATSPDADPSRLAGHSYRAPLRPTIDWAQRALDHARDAYEKQYPNADTAGHVWRVERVDP